MGLGMVAGKVVRRRLNLHSGTVMGRGLFWMTATIVAGLVIYGVTTSFLVAMLGRVCKVRLSMYLSLLITDMNSPIRHGSGSTPASTPKTSDGPAAVDHRRVLNGIRWLLRTGAPWRGSARTVWSLANGGQPSLPLAKDGSLGTSSLRSSSSRPMRQDTLGWTAMLSMARSFGPTSMPLAPQKGAAAEALGRRPGGFSPTVHLHAEGGGTLMTLVLTPGHRHEAVAFAALMASGVVPRPRGGRPKRRPRRVAGDQAYSRGDTLGRLHGVPYALKDLTVTKGIRTTFGSKIFEHHVPTEDAILVERLNAAGGILLGKTNTPEFGCKGFTDNKIVGTTYNPWDLELPWRGAPWARPGEPPVWTCRPTPAPAGGGQVARHGVSARRLLVAKAV